MADLYMTVQGRQKDTTEAIVGSAATLGVESSYHWIEDYTPEFVDYPFTDPDATFSDHLEVVRETQPTVAVAPDIEKGRTLAEVESKADRLAEYADEVVVVPKTVHPSEVPGRFRVGVPLADFGSGAPWSAWDYYDCGELHLLGGGPARQREADAHLPEGAVESIDTASLGKLSRYGYWDDGTRDAPGEWDYRRRLRASLDNYARTWT